MSGRWCCATSTSPSRTGTGLVHCAPGHGPEDFMIGKRFGIETFSPVDGKGKYTKEAGELAGRNVREANPLVIEILKDNGALVYESRIRHRYPHCWRCKTPLIFITTNQWFITISKIKEKMLNEIEKTEWHPDFRQGRASGSSSPARRTGASRASATGASPSRYGSAQLRQDESDRLQGRASAGEGAPPALHGQGEAQVRNAARRCTAHPGHTGRLVRLGQRRMGISRREERQELRREGRPHNRGQGPDTRLVLLASRLRAWSDNGASPTSAAHARLLRGREGGEDEQVGRAISCPSRR